MRIQHTSFFDRPDVRRTFAFLAVLMGVVYFFQITSASARGYELKKLTDKKATVLSDMHRIELQIAEDSSAHNLKKRLDSLGLTSAAHIEYVRADGHSVAVK